MAVKIFVPALVFCCVCSLSAPVLIKDQEHLFQLVRQFVADDAGVIEAGASDGRGTVKLAHVFPRGHIYSFEPVQESFELLARRAAGLANVRISSCALGGYEGTADMYLSHHPKFGLSSSSLLAPDQHNYYSTDPVDFSGSQKVTVVKLDNWLRGNGVSKIDFIWLDTQGTELNILMAAPIAVSSAKAIYIEVEFVKAYKDQFLFKDVRTWLEAQGFALHATNFVLTDAEKSVYNKGDRWCGDALFVRV